MGARNSKLAIGAGAFVAAFGLVWWFAAVDGTNAYAQQACDQADVAETVKNLATKYIKSNTSYLLHYVKFPSFDAFRAADGIFEPSPTYQLSAFRDRGAFGAAGKNCAVSVKAYLKAPASLDLISDYTIEPTTDGKSIVTARFSPNS